MRRKNDCPLKYFVVKGLTLEACRRTATIQIQPIFITTAIASYLDRMMANYSYWMISYYQEVIITQWHWSYHPIPSLDVRLH